MHFLATYWYLWLAISFLAFLGVIVLQLRTMKGIASTGVDMLEGLSRSEAPFRIVGPSSGSPYRIVKKASNSLIGRFLPVLVLALVAIFSFLLFIIGIVSYFVGK